MKLNLSHLSQYLSFDKVAQIISSQYNLNKTLSKSRINADVQPLNNITENPIIDKPMDVTVQETTFNKDTSLSHMKDNRLLRPRKFRKTF
jgi:hypothetical protein